MFLLLLTTNWLNFRFENFATVKFLSKSLECSYQFQKIFTKDNLPLRTCGLSKFRISFANIVGTAWRGRETAEHNKPRAISRSAHFLSRFAFPLRRLRRKIEWKLSVCNEIPLKTVGKFSSSHEIKQKIKIISKRLRKIASKEENSQTNCSQRKFSDSWRVEISKIHRRSPVAVSPTGNFFAAL